ncbi:uncharacterized protein LOC119111362 [Pollicipes pollicipes]|uniref:uncharacterized protein LOC119111362 n=1 Tax=Pollicipes pollicipes TaxID=41117 RepID=UPI0018854DAF|nr:uncharacterized protein LOC119111362 [Pollicipes pollicipes]
MELCRWSGVLLLLAVALVEPVADGRPAWNILCDRPAIVGGWVWQRASPMKSSVQYKCLKGHRRLGPLFNTCIGGRWIMAHPVCVRAGCPALAAPPGGVVRRQWRGAVVRFGCRLGRRLTGSPLLVCDGTRWNGTAPLCRGERRQRGRRKGHRVRLRLTRPAADGAPARLVSGMYPADRSSLACLRLRRPARGQPRVYVRRARKPLVDLQMSRLSIISSRRRGGRAEDTFQLPQLGSPFQVVIEGVPAADHVTDAAVVDVTLMHGDECGASAEVSSGPRFTEGVSVVTGDVQHGDAPRRAGNDTSCRPSTSGEANCEKALASGMGDGRTVPVDDKASPGPPNPPDAIPMTTEVLDRHATASPPSSAFETTQSPTTAARTGTHSTTADRNRAPWVRGVTVAPSGGSRAPFAPARQNETVGRVGEQFSQEPSVTRVVFPGHATGTIQREADQRALPEESETSATFSSREGEATPNVLAEDASTKSSVIPPTTEMFSTALPAAAAVTTSVFFAKKRTETINVSPESSVVNPSGVPDGRATTASYIPQDGSWTTNFSVADRTDASTDIRDDRADASTAFPHDRADASNAFPDDRGDAATAFPHARGGVSFAFPDDRWDASTAFPDGRADASTAFPHARGGVSFAFPDDRWDASTAFPDNGGDVSTAFPDDRGDASTAFPDDRGDVPTAFPDDRADTSAAFTEDRTASLAAFSDGNAGTSNTLPEDGAPTPHDFPEKAVATSNDLSSSGREGARESPPTNDLLPLVLGVPAAAGAAALLGTAMLVALRRRRGKSVVADGTGAFLDPAPDDADPISTLIRQNKLDHQVQVLRAPGAETAEVGAQDRAAN